MELISRGTSGCWLSYSTRPFSLILSVTIIHCKVSQGLAFLSTSGVLPKDLEEAVWMFDGVTGVITGCRLMEILSMPK